MLQSGKAGSLHRCLVTKTRSNILRLIVPPFPTPTSAISPGGSPRHPVENHIFDLSNRLKCFIPLVGGLTAGLLSQQQLPFDDQTIDSIHTLINGVKVVSNNITKNYRGGIGKRINDNKRHRRGAGNNGIADKPDFEAALDLLPPLVVVLVLFEDKIGNSRYRERLSDSDSWDLVEDGSHELDSLINEQMGTLFRCQEELSNLAGMLIAKAMIEGGGEVSTVIWRTIISSFESAIFIPENQVILENESSESKGKEPSGTSNGESMMHMLVRNNLLCRLTAIVMNLIVSGDRANISNPWTSVELCSATARLCDLVEEKNLLKVPSCDAMKDCDPRAGNHRLTLDQVRLLCALLDISKTGRENTGWCQLILPNPPARNSSFVTAKNERNNTNSNGNYYSLIEDFDDERKRKPDNAFFDEQILSYKDEIYDITSWSADDFIIGRHMEHESETLSTHQDSIASSKMLLPILQPTLRIILGSLSSIRGVAVIVQQKDQNDPTKETDSLFSVVEAELSSTVTAAIVGLAFSNARDVCLNTLSALRKGIVSKESENDEVVAAQYHKLFNETVNEMRIRYEGERLKREAAKQAYDGSESEAANSSQVESLLLGNSLTPLQKDPTSTDEHKSLLTQQESDDFIVFPHDTPLESKMNSFSSPRGSATLGWNNYKGETTNLRP